MKNFKMYEPRDDSFLLEKYVKKLAKGKVLDMGTGSGIQIEAALKNKKVNSALATDKDKNVIKKLKGKKYKIIYSDLFSNIKGKYDTIIFNPPYLPDSRYDNDKSLGGGKKGYELLVKFLDQASDYLTRNGIVLIVFSSITNKKKIDETIKKNLLKYKLLEKQKLFFETLFVYKIYKTDVLKKLENKRVKNLEFLAKGHRGLVFKGKYKNLKIAIKIKKPESKAVERIINEAKFLKIVNKKKIGPKLLFSSDKFLAYRFVEGDFILDYFSKVNKKQIKKILKNVLKQMYVLDKLKVNKEEMHHPLKHIIIKKKPVLIDFERCYYTEKPHNLTQFVQFILRINKNYNLNINIEKLINLTKKYKLNYKKEIFGRIYKLIN